MFQKIFITTTSIFVTFLFAFATIVNAQGTQGQYFGQVDDLFTRLSGFIDAVLIPLVFTLALLIFVWGMFRFFVYGAHNEDDRAKGRSLMIWSVIGLSLMVSIWGIVAIFSEGVFGISTGNQIPDLPKTPTL